jgi:hypothetical protein
MIPSHYLGKTLIERTQLRSELAPKFYEALRAAGAHDDVIWKLRPDVHFGSDNERWLHRVVLEGRWSELDYPFGVTVHKSQDETLAIRTTLVDELIAYMVDKLNASHVCPEDYYFGTLEGDASDFGFWPIDELPDSDQGIDVYAVPVLEAPSSEVKQLLDDNVTEELQVVWDTMQTAVERWIIMSGQSFDATVDYLRACLSADDVI